MEKKIQFTSEQKSIIWNRFIAPAEGTAEEARHFVDYCETLGLNPLIGDIVFQRYKSGGQLRARFVETRDGLLKMATRHPDFVGPPISNVVREGDEFEFNPTEGSVRHKYGITRGMILGAYSVLCHRHYRPHAVWVDFDEYFHTNAKSQGGISRFWDERPCSMIQKVAECISIRRLFLATEYMPLDEMEGEDCPSDTSLHQIGSELASNGNTENVEAIGEQQEISISNEGIPELPDGRKDHEQVDVKKATVVLENLDQGVSPSGVSYAKLTLATMDTGEKRIVLANEDVGLALAKTVPLGTPIVMQTVLRNGFPFLRSFEPASSGIA